jgi:dodecin
MAVVKIIELIGTSSKSSDDAVQQALAEARSSLRNIDVVSTGLRGDNLDEWRAHVRVAFLIERVSE